MQTPELRHQRYSQQAQWTAALQQHVIQALDLNKVCSLLEVGSGTGAANQSINRLLNDSPREQTELYGIDLRFEDLSFAKSHQTSHRLACADGLALPFRDRSFEGVFCHFLLMWLEEPLQALREMRRVTRPGGPVIAFAEPDYGGRIDYPRELAELGALQTRSLRAQGADPEMGRKLAHLFQSAGIKHVYTGILGGEWSARAIHDGDQLEWETLAADLTGQVSPAGLAHLGAIERTARENGERILYVPTFYCWGRAPE